MCCFSKILIRSQKLQCQRFEFGVGDGVDLSRAISFQSVIRSFGRHEPDRIESDGVEIMKTFGPGKHNAVPSDGGDPKRAVCDDCRFWRARRKFPPITEYGAEDGISHQLWKIGIARLESDR